MQSTGVALRNRRQIYNGLTSQSTEYLRQIVKKEPWLHRDEIMMKVLMETGKLLNMTSISRWIRRALKFSLKVISVKAIQQCQVERANCQYALEIHIKHLNMCVFIDEAHKTKNASFMQSKIFGGHSVSHQSRTLNLVTCTKGTRR